MNTPSIVAALAEGVEKDGELYPRLPVCASCITKPCTKSRTRGKIELCEFGVCYLPVSDRLLFFGFIPRGWRPAWTLSAQRRKRFARIRKGLREDQQPDAAALLRLAAVCAGAQAKTKLAEVLRHRKEEQRSIETQLAAVPKEVVLAQLQKNLRGLSSALIHDLLQLLASIYQNIDFLLSEQYGNRSLAADFPGPLPRPDVTPVECWRKEKAIYFAAELMTARLETARLVMTEGMADDELIWFSPHRLLVKFVRIYRSVAAERALNFQIGEGWYECRAGRRTATVALLNVVDNAVKYAPVGTVIRVDFQFDSVAMTLGVTCESLGPPLSPGEEETIFLPGERGTAAQAMVKDGSGIGLWQARATLGKQGEISVEQDPWPDRQHPQYRLTRFVIEYLEARTVERQGAGRDQ